MCRNLAAAVLFAALAQAPAPSGAVALPGEVSAALQRAGVPEEAVSVVVQDLASGRALLSWQAEVPRNPASLVKLVTTVAALERLGPAFTWNTPVWLGGPIKDGVLEGPLHIKGSGDPKLVLERAWLLLRRVQQLGVREIRGDIVLDQSAFAASDSAPGDFDGERLRPYNVKPVALLLNYRSALYTFTPDAAAGVARIGVEAPFARAAGERTVPLVAGPCEDWRDALKASTGNDGLVRFAGQYAGSCGELVWPMADAQPASFDARFLAGLWREMGGTLSGQVRHGPAPADAKPTFESRSPSLAEVARDMNKFSSNVTAEQLFLTLALQAAPTQPASPEAARALLQRWLLERFGEAAQQAVIQNGSGLSRESRLSAQLLARLLAAAFASPVMPELMASLPISASDGTLRRSRAAAGRAHLKTGSLRDVTGIAGYVLAPAGRRLVLVAIVNHPRAQAAMPALDALVAWVAQTPSPREPAARAGTRP